MAISLYSHDQNNGDSNRELASLSDLLKDWQKQSDLLRKDLLRMIED